jgi:hypothetical protein
VGFKSPQFHHHNAAGQGLALPSFSGASCRYLIARFCASRCSLDQLIQCGRDGGVPVPPDLNFPHTSRSSCSGTHRPDRQQRAHRTRLGAQQPARSPRQPATARCPGRAHGRSKRSTGSATSPSPKTPAASAPPPAPRSCPPCATSRSRCSASPVTLRSPHAALGQPESCPRPGVPRPSHEPANTQTRSRRGPGRPGYGDPHQPPTSLDGHLVRSSRAPDGRNLRPRERFSLRRHEGT